MKTLFKTFAYAAIAALALSSCAKEKLQPADELTGKLVTVHFGTENTDPSTKATLTPDDGETAFQAAWEKGDEISIEQISPESNNDIIVGTWDATNKKFSASLPDETGSWAYQAAYPVPSVSDNSVDFGANRTQKGNAYNSKYDIMIGAADTKNSAAGKDDNGKDIVFPMTRQTAIAYFHFTSELNESLVSATLKVTDGAIANSAASINDFKFVAPLEGDKTEIKLTFEDGTAPSANDFQLWFNVLPRPYSSMTLTVETATKTFTISKSTGGEYKVGKLYKVKKKGISWTDKGVAPSGPTISKISSASDFTAGTYIIMTYNETYYVPNNAATSKGPKLGSVVKNDGIIKITPDMIWNATVSGEGLEFTSYTEAENKLWGAPTNNGVRINKTNTANNASTVWKLASIDSYGLCGYAGESGTDKYYLSTYSENDWRNYKYANNKFGADGNIPANFYKVEGWVDNNHSINVATVEGGTLSASVNMAEEGTEITLTATPDEGYSFNNDWTVTNAETSKSISVKDGKFTMPAANVNVTASFGVVPFLNASADVTSVSAQGGTVSITVNTNAESWTAESDNAAFVVGTTIGNTVQVVVSKNQDAAVRTATITISAGSLTDEINLTQAAAGQVSSKQYTLTITKDDFSSISYADNNKDKTTSAIADDGTKIAVTWYSYQIMLQSSAMQWQKKYGYIYNKTDLGEIVSVTVNSTDGSFTTYYGTAQNPTSGTNVSGGYFTTKVGNATGKTTSVVIKFKK